MILKEIIGIKVYKLEEKGLDVVSRKKCEIRENCENDYNALS